MRATVLVDNLSGECLAGERGLAIYISHEQSLVLELEESGGLAVFSSCSHAGAANILREVQAAFPGRPVRALVGGFHMYETPEADIRALAGQLRTSGVETIVTGHCTGQEAYALLRQELGEQVSQMRAGMVIEIP